MIKKISIYFFSFLVLFGVSFTLHSLILKSNAVELRFSLLETYVFHTIISFVITAMFLLLSNSEKWAAQLGFIYIFTFVTKFMFFVIAFKNSIFEIKKLTNTESLNLLIPVFLFLFLEVYFIAKILNNK